MEVCEEKKQKFDQQKKDNEITNHLDDDLTEREHQNTRNEKMQRWMAQRYSCENDFLYSNITVCNS